MYREECQRKGPTGGFGHSPALSPQEICGIVYSEKICAKISKKFFQKNVTIPYPHPCY
jgi:hypothetical protein